MDLICQRKILRSYVGNIVNYYKRQQLLLLVKIIQENSDDKKIVSLRLIFSDDPTLLRYTSTENIPEEENERNDT
jgi:hypothetical protein